MMSNTFLAVIAAVLVSVTVTALPAKSGLNDYVPLPNTPENSKFPENIQFDRSTILKL